MFCDFTIEFDWRTSNKKKSNFSKIIFRIIFLQLLVYGNKTVSQYYVIATYGSGYQDKMCVTEQLVKINSTFIEGARQYLIRGDKTLQTQRALHTIEKTEKSGFFRIKRQGKYY